jgi:hypothetical protein
MRAARNPLFFRRIYTVICRVYWFNRLPKEDYDSKSQAV